MLVTNLLYGILLFLSRRNLVDKAEEANEANFDAFKRLIM
jgi:hypothetical protein